MELIGLGCMRLSIERDRDEARAVAVLHAALDAGVTLLASADAHGWDEADAGHNERPIARAMAPVQVELSVWNDDNALSGVLDYCATNGIRLLAYRPLGGAKRARRAASEPVLVEIAARHDATPQEIALAWLTDLADVIVPIPGATRVETAQSIARAQTIVLTDGDREQLAT